MDVCPFTNVQKSHDFDLNDPIDPELTYIVQIRSFELAVESWFKLAKGEGYASTFEDFRKEKSDYFDGFMEKWVNSKDIPNRLTIPYHDLVTERMSTAIKAYRHITDLTLDENRLSLIRQWSDCESAHKPTKAIEPKLSLFNNID